MEADVNVLVVGSSTARCSAIGRHFPFPLIRRRREPVLSAGQARQGRGPPSRVVGRGGHRGCVCVCVGGRDQPSLLMNMAD